MEEIWKPIKGYEGLYSISNLGRVMSHKRFYRQEDNLMKLWCNKQNNYFMGTLFKDSKTNHHTIHRLMMNAHVDNPKQKKCINHINGNRQDNRLENLEWVTHSENNIHANRVLGKRNMLAGMKGRLLISLKTYINIHYTMSL